MVTTLALILIGVSLASGPLGWPLGGERAEQASLVAHSDAAALEPIDAEVYEALSYRETTISYRGGERPGDVFLNRPMPAPDAPAAADEAAGAVASTEPSSAAEASPEPTEVPEPATTASPQPTMAPEPTATPEPTAEPAAEPFVAMSVPMLTGMRVGIQSGHMNSEQFPAELASLRTSTGAAGKGWTEREINLQLSRKVIALLEARGIEVDLIPATVPPNYRADAFVSIHGDANNNTSLSGFKIARSARSTIPAIEDKLVAAMRAEYEKGTGLRWHQSTITLNMLHYYAFNQRLQHSVSPNTPSVILEIGFLTNGGDLRLVTQEQDRVAQAIASGIVRFLAERR
jgi:N-acetylmuramoyl-L-alanine amidase